jgi:DNA mismatch repair ATPase MutL
VRVERLFEKVPARRKFLRSPRAEYAACHDSVKRLALARSDVAYTLEHDGRNLLSLQPSSEPALLGLPRQFEAPAVNSSLNGTVAAPATAAGSASATSAASPLPARKRMSPSSGSTQEAVAGTRGLAGPFASGSEHS